MNENAVMKAIDAVAGGEGRAFITINNNRYCLFNIVNFKAELEISIGEVSSIGRRMKGHKPGMMSGKWSGSVHYNNDVLRLYWKHYKYTGDMPTFEMQITNDDKTSAAGKHTVIIKQCYSEGGVLVQLDADSETLTEDISGTFDDFEMPDTFKNLSGM